MSIQDKLCPINLFETKSETVSDADRKMLALRDALAWALNSELREIVAYKEKRAEWVNRVKTKEDYQYEANLHEYNLELARQKLLPAAARDIISPPKAPITYQAPPIPPEIALLEPSVISRVLGQQLSDTLVGKNDLSMLGKAIERQITPEDLERIKNGEN